MKCVKSLPDEIGQLKNLSFFSLPDNPHLKTLPDSNLNLSNLLFVNLKGSKPTLSEKFKNTYSEEGAQGSGFFTKKM
jgi:hypothetical protein